jgi:hypothetical protein
LNDIRCRSIDSEATKRNFRVLFSQRVGIPFALASATSQKLRTKIFSVLNTNLRVTFSSDFILIE